MKNINNVSSEYLVNTNSNKVDTRIGVCVNWNSMTKDERTGWYEADQEHLTFSRESTKIGIQKMIRDLTSEDGYDGMAETCAKFITEDHVDQIIAVLNDITRVPAFLVIEERGEMIDPNIDLKCGECEVE